MTTIIDGSAGITFPNSTVQASAGSVLQVVNASYATQVTSASSTFADTGLTASITPKFATSKILVLIEQNGLTKITNATGVELNLLRGSTTIVAGFAGSAGNNAAAQSNYVGGASVSYLDSPATTSATTYKTQFNSTANNGTTLVQVGNINSTITLMEIAG